MTSVLVIDDDPASRLALVTALAPHYTVSEASTVATALAALARNPYDAIVCDLVLDGDRAPLHDVLVHQGRPVVLVSGVQPEQLPAVAAEHGWRYASKPAEPETLVRLVREAIARRETPPPSRPPDVRATVVPAPPPRALTPPEGSPAVTPRDPRVEIRDLETRRRLRALCALVVGLLTAYFEQRGHAVPGLAIGCVTGLGLGLDAITTALQKRPGVAAGGVAGLVALALAGEVSGVREISHLSALGAGALPIVDSLAERISP